MLPNLICGAAVLLVGRLSDRLPTYVLVLSGLGMPARLDKARHLGALLECDLETFLTIVQALRKRRPSTIFPR